MKILLAIMTLLIVSPAYSGPGAGIVVTTQTVIRQAADSSACYNIQDSDARTMCLARAHREPAQCYSIQRADMRSMCLSEVRK